jgi:hypothetical protein
MNHIFKNLKKNLLEIKQQFRIKKKFSEKEINHIVAYARLIVNSLYNDITTLKSKLQNVLDHCFNFSHLECPEDICQYKDLRILEKKEIASAPLEEMQKYFQKMAEKADRFRRNLKINLA